MVTVKVYSTQWCPWCHRVKEWLKEHGIPFEDIDVGVDQTAAEEMIAKSGQQGVPVVDIDGRIIVGYDEFAMREALGLPEED